MSQIFNIYCDESGHLEKDEIPVMVLGAIWCPSNKAKETATRIRDIKKRHGLKPDFEIKWSKVSPAKVGFYQDVLDYFFDEGNLYFRALVVSDKTKLDHKHFNQEHDTWYYKMYFNMLKAIISPEDRYRIYIDIKDTRSKPKRNKLHEVLCCNMYDFNRSIIERIQAVRSHEIEHIQLADLLIGIISYSNRNLKGNSAKLSLVRRMMQRSGLTLIKSTLLWAKKVNLFVWRGESIIND